MCKACIQKLKKTKDVLIFKTISEDLASNHSEWFMEAFFDFVEFVNEYFTSQEQTYIDSLASYPELKLEKSLIPESDEIIKKFEKKLEAVFLLWMGESKEKVLKELVDGGYDEYLEVLELLDNTLALDYAQNRAWALIKGINETTQKEMSKLITKGIKEAKSISDIASEINEKFKSYNLYRSTLIATMEVANAYSEAQSVTYSDISENIGVVWWKRAITQDDSNVRPSHLANEEAWWIPRNMPYPGTGTMQAPHEFYCRCVDDYSVVNPETWLLFD